MSDDIDALREGETVLDALPPEDVGVVFIGVIHTPFKTRADCPHQGSQDGPDCRVEVFAPFAPALEGVESAQLDILYWLHEARRDLLTQRKRGDGVPRGTFALRSPLRPNPIGLSTVRLVRREGDALIVRGLDCLDGTPLLDIKPVRCPRA